MESAWAWGVAAVALLGLFAAFVVSLYNGLVRVRGEVRKAWGNIDVLLQRRHDELGALAELSRGAMDEERRALEAVAKLRGDYDRASTSGEKTEVENALNRALAGLWERHPRLRTDELTRRLQARITELENALADQRGFFNDTVTLYNTHLDAFPQKLLARPLGFAPHALLEAR
jgi:LemA protein